MNAYSALWGKLAVKAYREKFVAAQVKRAIPAQIRSLMEESDMSQLDLAKASGLTQGVISRAANPNYGNLTLNTIIRIAAGFDVAFVGQFVPFSDLARWFLQYSDKKLGNIATFEEENARSANRDDPSLLQSGPESAETGSLSGDELLRAKSEDPKSFDLLTGGNPYQTHLYFPPPLNVYDGGLSKLGHHDELDASDKPNPDNLNGLVGQKPGQLQVG